VRRLLLIANPAASGFTGGRFRAVIDILGRGFHVTPAWPSGARDARRVAAQAAADGYDVVVAMGGDGVVHHVANGLVGLDTALGVIPAGTTNVLARILGLPARPEKAAAALLDATPEWTPMAYYVAERAGGPVESGYAAFSLGVGFDAEVVAEAETRPHSKLRFGSIHYARTVAGKLFRGYKHVPATLRVECEGRRVDAVSVVVAVHTPYTYFGALPLRLAREHEDGLVAIAIERLGPWRAAQVISRALLGRPLEQAAVHVWRGFGKLIVEAEPAAAAQTDGEGLGKADAVEVAPAPASVLLLHPHAR
jgi:diacylglycerol kinase family enzyme